MANKCFNFLAQLMRIRGASNIIMKFYIIALFSFISIAIKAADPQWDEAIFNKCNTAKEIGYLSIEEKSVIFYLNLVRVNPKLFAQTYLKNYLDTAPINQTEYLKSLQKELNTLKPMDLLKPQFDLYEVAKKHATEMGMQGKTGHISLSGKNFESRAKELSKRYKKLMENCQYGYADGLSIVIDLLIDEDIPELGHRKSLLNKDVKFIGTSIQKHKIYQYNCVIEMGSDLN
jgi:uncharacterized protein YkwD